MMSLEDKIMEALRTYDEARQHAYDERSPGALNNLLAFWRAIDKIMKEHMQEHMQ